MNRVLAQAEWQPDRAMGERNVREFDLVVKAQEGDERAFAELMIRYAGRVFLVAMRILEDEEDALDVMQNVFMKAFQRLSSFAFHSFFGTWVTKICINTALDELSRKQRHLTDSDSDLELLVDERSIAMKSLNK
jgi:RNA polymerase sigma factor (sigma-70 family)